MKYGNAIHKILFAITGIAAGFPALHAGIDAEWRLHPAIDIDSNAYYTNSYSVNTNVLYMAEGERYLYALMSSQLKNSVYSGFEDYYYIPARFDKQEPGGVMTPLSSEYELSGVYAEDMAYALKGGYVVIAYSNGCIDILYDDGRLLSNKDYYDTAALNPTQFNLISLDAEEKYIFITTKLGYVKIDAATAEIVETRQLITQSELLSSGEQINFVTEAAGRTIIATNKTIYYINAGEKISSFADVHPLTTSAANCDASARLMNADGTLKSPNNLISGAGGMVYYVGPNSTAAGTGFSINAISLPAEDGEYARVINLFGETFSRTNQIGYVERYVCKYYGEGLLSPSRDGFTYSSNNNFYHVSIRDNAPADLTAAGIADFKSRVVEKIAKDLTHNAAVSLGDERDHRAASYDGKAYYFFRPQRGFEKRRAEASGATATWTDVEELREVNANAVKYPEYIHYIPGKGIYTVGFGGSYFRYGNYDFRTPGRSLYSNGKWEQHSQKHEDYALHAAMPQARGMVFDPADSRYYYATYPRLGLMRVNIEDKRDVFVWGYSGYNSAAVANIYKFFPSTSLWLRAPFSVPDFDADGTMWTFTENPIDVDNLILYYWSAEDRLASTTAADYEQHQMKGIKIPGSVVRWNSQTVAARHEKNRGLILFVMGTYVSEGSSLVYDTNCTPDDPTDDKVYYLDKLIDENGDSYSLNFTNRIFEDPEDGTFIVSDTRGLVTFSREDLMEDHVRIKRLMPRYADTGLTAHAGLTRSDCLGMAVDGEGRKWLTSTDAGVYVLSPDRNTLIAHFDSSNSPLEEDEAYGIAYNPETDSMFIGMKTGVAECALPGSENHSTLATVQATPGVVDPDYKGYVRVSGLSDGKVYEVLDENGLKAGELRSRGGVAQWEPAGMPSGVYTIGGASVIVLK